MSVTVTPLCFHIHLQQYVLAVTTSCCPWSLLPQRSTLTTVCYKMCLLSLRSTVTVRYCYTHLLWYVLSAMRGCVHVPCRSTATVVSYHICLLRYVSTLSLFYCLSCLLSDPRAVIHVCCLTYVLACRLTVRSVAVTFACCDMSCLSAVVLVATHSCLLSELPSLIMCMLACMSAVMAVYCHICLLPQPTAVIWVWCQADDAFLLLELPAIMTDCCCNW